MAVDIEFAPTQPSAAAPLVPLSTLRTLLGLATGGLMVIGLLEGGGGAVWPNVIDAFGASKGLFGFASGMGLILSFPILLYGSKLTALFDKRILLFVCGLVMAVAAFGLALGSGPALLVALLALRGMSLTMIDLSSNALAMEIEQQTGRHIMSPMHAGFSGGALAGAALGWLVFELGGGHQAVFSVLGVLFVLFAVSALLEYRSRPMSRAAEPEGGSGLSFALFKRPDIRAYSVLACVSFAAELLIAQWVSIYLVDELGYADRVGAWAVMLLMGTMFLTRLVNGPITEHVGARRMVFAQGAGVFLGGLMIVATGEQWLILAGCGVAGIGLAGLAPTVLHLAGKAVPEDAGGASGATLIGGYAGVAVMPFIAGWVASEISVRGVLCAEMIGGAIVIAIAVMLGRMSLPAMARD